MNYNFQSEFKDNSEASIGLSFIKVYNLWHKRIKDQLKRIELTHPQFIVLASLGYLSQKYNEVNQVDISKKSDMDVMTVSTIVRKLEKSGLVNRKNSTIDTRAKSIVLTDSGQKKLAEALPIVEKVDHDFFDRLGKDRTDLNRLLLQLIDSE
ncbi:MarR family winged helix-turn-helix transcriptional regulator [Enterococcus sp. DIV0187]|uniref:MarR family winged helix-turn-helix transcriptional regulator n=1 Tax=Enterococcus sp. DIV0187 TaxID=2774644 RepID=UPI003F25F066